MQRPSDLVSRLPRLDKNISCEILPIWYDVCRESCDPHNFLFLQKGKEKADSSGKPGPRNDKCVRFSAACQDAWGSRFVPTGVGTRKLRSSPAFGMNTKDILQQALSFRTLVRRTLTRSFRTHIMKNKKPNAEHIWKQFEDHLVPRLRLSVIDRAVYSHLLRHSRLEGKLRLRFSILWLARNIRLSGGPAREAVRRLAAKGVFRLVER